jgi:hypothetical protein
MAMGRVVVFGASPNSKKLYDRIREEHEIILFVDNDRSKIGGMIEGISVAAPEEILKVEFDEVIVTSNTAMYIIQNQLLEMGVERYKINLSYVELLVKARVQFLSDYAQIVYENEISGSAAEAGVFQGEFAKVINEKFPDRKCYLFDTFEGFHEKDILIERENDFSEEKTGHLNMTSEELVLGKMKHAENCIIRKGYFPETAAGVEDTFCFVNLDMDLYKPTLEGLRFFWDRLEKGGIILIHDYFSEEYKGVKRAVDEFRFEKDISVFPIGDSISIAMIKT